MQQQLQQRQTVPVHRPGWKRTIRRYLKGRTSVALRDVLEAVGAGAAIYETPVGLVQGHLLRDLDDACLILDELRWGRRIGSDGVSQRRVLSSHARHDAVLAPS
jgi:hypothetical protein